MFTATITNIERTTHQASGQDFLDVAIELTDGEQVFQRKHGFDVAIEKEDLQSEVEKILSAFQLEQDQAQANAEKDAEDARITEMSEDLIGVEITINDKKDDV